MRPLVRQLTRDIRQSVTTSATTLFATLYSYSVVTSAPTSTLLMRWNCPFAGNQIGGTRSAVQLLLDGEVVARSMKFNSQNWELHPFVLDASVPEVGAGSHLIEVRARVSDGTLHMPHYNPNLLEGETGLDVILILIELPG